jgi:hypothetical protein
VDQKKYLRYAPKNLPKDVDYTKPSRLESDYFKLCRGDPEHKKRGKCALYRKLPTEQGLVSRWRTRKQRRFLKEWAKDLPG